MIPVTLAELADLVGGTVSARPGPIVTGPVVTDSREAEPGSLYVARVGEHADGHVYCGPARDHGAVAALTTRPVPELPCLVVPDVQAAFDRISRWVVDTAVAGPGRLTVVGVTGSSGKTSTKDLLGAVLRAHGATVVPEGSLNSEVGVPLTVCRVTPDTRYLVVEMGARGLGHIAHLTQVAPPSIGVVLNVGSAHVGEFGSREAIATAKAELVEALPAGGLAVLNADDPLVRAMAARTRARVVLVGEAADADIRATDLTLDPQGRPTATVTTPAGTGRLRLSLVGRHHIGNALAVLAVALEVGIGLDAALDAVGAAGPVSRWRMEVTGRPDGVTVVNDAYNANPESMRAAVDALSAMDAGRRWAVLGSMLELGDESEHAHAGVGLLTVERHLDEVIAVGEATRSLAAAARAHSTSVGCRTHVRWVPDAEGAEELLRAELAPGDVVLFKSSRDAGLRWLGDRISGRTEEAS